MDNLLSELECIIDESNAELIFINSKGEVFVNDKISDIIDFIKSKGLVIRLLSNGYLLGRDEYKYIANKCDEVKVERMDDDIFKKKLGISDERYE
ncbi:MULTISPECIES: hypothetical protein [unclassified Romboutsia]|uniref:hypothetical protein n=1 Tax=unclassified Romboutsia TaxID=2626894 RepID=UPI0008207FCB|nr:Uncharacterised protein [uncultured Clostridium sp.]